MAEDDQDESSKTEEASERKLERAREEGHVPMSQEVKSWFMLWFLRCFDDEIGLLLR